MKSLSNLQSVLSLFRDRDTLLVCETDGFCLRGAVLRRNRDQLTVEYSHQSQATAYQDATRELVDVMRQKGWRGKRAILLTPGVLTTLIELPLPLDTKLPILQMQEMIRWELEPLLMQHITLWSVGRILVGLGYLTEEQVKEVLDRQQGRKKTDGSDLDLYSFKRFGELAVEMEFIDRLQMDECLQRQEWLRQDGEEFACGWSPQTASDEESGQYYWLVSGANIGMMKQWASVFAKYAVSLEAVYPLVSPALTLLPKSETALLLEVHARMVCGVRIKDGAVISLQSHQCMLESALDACLESYHALTPPDINEVWLAADEFVGISESLHQKLGKPVLDVPSEKNVSPSMLGAAKHILGMKLGIAISAVLVGGPKLPILQRPKARAFAAIALIVSCILIAEFSLHVRQWLVNLEHQRIASQKAEIDTATNRVKKHNDEITKVQATLAAKQRELASFSARAEFFGFELAGRSAMLQSLLEQLAAAVNDDVVLNNFVEATDGSISVGAWALSDSAAQQFVIRVKSLVREWGVDVTNVVVENKQGRLGMLGSEVRFTLVESDEIAAEVAKAAEGRGVVSYE